MKYIKSYTLFESEKSIPSPISIEEFLDAINMPFESRQTIIEWWIENRNRIQIHYFPFNRNMMAYGAVFSNDSIAINSNFNADPLFTLYIALHESAHSDQANEQRINPYFDTVVADDLDNFILAYNELEQEANDYAEQSMIELGFNQFIRQNVGMLRQNLNYALPVFQAMKRDIQKYKPESLTDLIRNMIL